MLGHVQSTAEVPLSKAPNPPTHCSERLLKAAASPTPLPAGLHAHAFIMRSYIQHVSCTHNHSVITAAPPPQKNNGFWLTEKKLAYRNTKCNIKARHRSQFVSGQTYIIHLSFILFTLPHILVWIVFVHCHFQADMSTSKKKNPKTYFSIHRKFACSINLLAAFTRNIKNDPCGGTENCIHGRG